MDRDRTISEPRAAQAAPQSGSAVDMLSALALPPLQYAAQAIARVCTLGAPGSYLPTLDRFGIFSEPELYQIARRELLRLGMGGRSAQIAAVVRYLGPQDRALQRSVALDLASAIRPEHIKDCGITDQSVLTELAKKIITTANQIPYENHGYINLVKSLASNITSVGIKDQDARKEIFLTAWRFHRSGHVPTMVHLARCVRDFAIEPEAARVEIAKEVIKTSQGSAFDIKDFDIEDLSARRIIGRAIAEINLDRFVPNEYGITERSELVEIAKLRAKLIRCDDDLNDYGIDDPQLLGELAQIRVAHHPLQIASHISYYCISDPATVRQLYRTAISKDFIVAFCTTRETLYAQPRREAFSLYLKEKMCSSEPYGTTQVLASAFRELMSSPFWHPEQRKHVFGDVDFDNSEPHEIAKLFIEWFREEFDSEGLLTDELLPANLEVQSEEVIWTALAAMIVCWDRADVARYGRRDRASLAMVSGFESIPTEKLSPNSSRELWGVLSTALGIIGADVAAKVPVDLAANRAQALRVMTLAIGLKGSGGELPLFSETIATKEEYQRAEEILTEQLTAAFRKLLSISNIGDKDAVAQLWDTWGGDLSPFTVLAGRFNPRESWRGELPVLSEIAKRCLDGSFDDWRYRRDDEQLAFLSDKQLRGWRTNRVQITGVTAGKGGETASEEAQVQNAQRIFETNILMHIPEEVAGEVRLKGLSKDEAGAMHKLEDKEFGRQGLAAVVRLLQFHLAKGELDIVREVAGRMRSLANTLFEGTPEDVKKQLLRDLSDLKDATKRVKVQAGSEYCVVSVITDHPKLLLMTGDLVQASSCQNYRTGEWIQTLPGYVIDGNIKLALSYVVKREVVERLSTDFSQIEFDPSTQSLRLAGSLGDGIRLGYAMRREVLRLGEANKEAVCVIEPPYLQNHAISVAIAEQQRAIVAEHLNVSQVRSARKGDDVKCPASRNPGGVYSDCARGVKRGKYTVPM